jgi:hypothetical protein
MKDIYILEIMAGIVAAVAILILGSWPWAGITLVLGIPCAICLTAAWQTTKYKTITSDTGVEIRVKR